MIFVIEREGKPIGAVRIDQNGSAIVLDRFITCESPGAGQDEDQTLIKG
jgi:hypothetical protein